MEEEDYRNVVVIKRKRKVINQCVCSEGSVRVEHDSERGSHGFGREISGERGSDRAAVSVGLDDSAPYGSEPGVVFDGPALEDVGDTFAEVEVSVFLVVDAFNL